MDRWVGQNANTNKVPLHPKVDLSKIPLPDVPDTYLTGLYAQLIGELVFVGINTQPAIMQAGDQPSFIKIMKVLSNLLNPVIFVVVPNILIYVGNFLSITVVVVLSPSKL